MDVDKSGYKTRCERTERYVFHLFTLVLLRHWTQQRTCLVVIRYLKSSHPWIFPGVSINYYILIYIFSYLKVMLIDFKTLWLWHVLIQSRIKPVNIPFKSNVVYHISALQIFIPCSVRLERARTSKFLHWPNYVIEKCLIMYNFHFASERIGQRRM